MESKILEFLLQNSHNPLAIIALFIFAVIYAINHINKKEKLAKKNLSEIDFEHYEKLKCIKYNEIITLLEETNKLIATSNTHFNENLNKLTKIHEDNAKQNEMLRDKLSEHLMRQKMTIDLLLNFRSKD